MFINADKENTYSFYNLEDEFGMIKGEKTLLPDFSLLTDDTVTDNADCSIMKGEPVYLGCQNVMDITTTDIFDLTVTNDVTTDSKLDIVNEKINMEMASETSPVLGNFSSDEKIVAAVLASLETNSMTPLIKEGLRSTIQNKRLKEGKRELEVRFTPYKKREPQTEAEIMRAEKRKDQNKMAARRFRHRQRQGDDHLLKKIKKIEMANTTLMLEITNLQKDKEELNQILQTHLTECQHIPIVNFP